MLTTTTSREATLEAPAGELLDALPHPAWLAAPDGAVTRCNGAALELFACPEDDLRGDGWLTRVSQDDVGRVEHAWRAAVTECRPFLVEAKLLGHARAGRWHSLKAAPLLEKDGRLRCWVASCSDIHARKAAEEQARTSERRFRAVFERAPLGVAIVDGQGRWRDVNAVLCRMLGRGEAELLGGRCGDVLHPADRGDHESAARRLAAGDIDGYCREERYLRKDGSELWVRLNAARLEDEDALSLCLLEDITARRSAEDARQESEEALRQRTAELETLYATAPVGLALVDVDGIVVRANRAQLDGLGFSSSFGAVGQPLLPQAPEVRRHILGVIETGEPAVGVDVTVRDSRQETRFLRGTFVGLRDASGAVNRVSCTLYDVTQQRRYEAALEEAARHKDQFLAVLGHELRNPLAAISTAAELLRRRFHVHEPSVEGVRAIVERQTAHMTRLIDGLLDVSRIARGKVILHRRRTNLGALVRGVLDDRAAMFHSSRLTLCTDLPEEGIYVDVDATRMAQVLDNLLTNAMKFTDPGGEITVRLTCTDAEARLSVSDTGSGIDGEHLEALFEPFRQAEETVERTAGGLGLGLALVRGLVELHGGRVWARSEGRGRGATFEVALPRADLIHASELARTRESSVFAATSASRRG